MNMGLSDRFVGHTESQVLIRFQDCDPLQHLNNAKYFDYYFNARDDQVNQIYGFNFAEIYRKHQTGWVIYNHNISYIAPAFPGEWVQIFSALLYYNEDTLLIEYLMTDEHCTTLKNMLWSTMKYVDTAAGRRSTHQPDVTEMLEKMVVPQFDLSYLAMGKEQKSQRIRELKALLDKRS